MTKRLQAIGNSSGIIIDRPILDLLGITQETDLDMETDGKRLIITPLQDDGRRKRMAKVQSRALRNHAETFWLSMTTKSGSSVAATAFGTKAVLTQLWHRQG